MTAPAAASRNPRRAIVCSAQHWSAPVHLSAHHLAKFLVARGWHVAFVSTPTSLLHRLRFARDKVVVARFANWRSGGGRDLDGRLFHYTPLAAVPPARVPGLEADWLLHNWVRLAVPSVERVLGREGFGRLDLAVIDSALMLPLWQRLGRPRLVYRVTDRNADFPHQPAGLKAMERTLAAAAEMVVCTGETLLPYVAALSPRDSLCVPNGVDVAHFAMSRPLPTDLAAIPAPRAIYVGSLGAWLDFDLVARTAARLPQVSFVVIGPKGDATPQAATLPGNVHVLGPRPYAAIPAYLAGSDVGLIPFRRQGMEAFVDDINPLKLYEYMAAGLPVVSTPMAQVARLASPAVVVEDAEGMAAAIRAACARTDKGLAERAFAARYDWSGLFQPLAERLGL